MACPTTFNFRHFFRHVRDILVAAASLLVKVISHMVDPKRTQRRAQLEGWYQEHWPDLYRYVYHYVQNRQEAEDLAQEAFSRVITRRGDEPLPTRQYLFTAAHNLIRDRWRRKAGVLLPLEERFLERADNDEVMQTRVQEMLDQLPPDYRAVLELRIVQGYSRAETAQRLERTEDAIRSMQYRALQLLRNRASQEMEVGGR